MVFIKRSKIIYSQQTRNKKRLQIEIGDKLILRLVILYGQF